MKTFIKAQLSSFTGAVVDYLCMILLTEVFGVFYTYSIIMGGIVGAVVNFYINRNWSFRAKGERKRVQLMKFSCMVAGSVLMKSYGTLFLTNLTGLDYKLTRLMVDAVVAFGFNYPLQKYWIFGKKEAEA